MLNIVYPIYNPKPHVLEYHYDNWNTYPEELKKQMHVIMVDDGSQPPIKFNPPLPNYTHIRIEEDIYWNASGVKNVAFHVVPKDSWVFASDIDHILEASDCQKCIDLVKEKENVYWFIRIKEGIIYKQHPNTFLINSDDYWKFGGYDEDFAGNGGYNDVMTQNLMQYVGLKHINIPIVIYLNENLSYTTKSFIKKGRKINKLKLDNKLRQLRQGIYMHPNNLNFTWRIINGHNTSGL